MAESQYKKGLNFFFFFPSWMMLDIFWVKYLFASPNLGYLLCIESIFNHGLFVLLTGFHKGRKVSISIVCSTTYSGENTFWKLHTGTNGDSESTAINFTFNHEMKSRQEAGVYGWSGNWRSAASLFLTTTLAYAKTHIFGKKFCCETPVLDAIQGEADQMLF